MNVQHHIKLGPEHLEGNGGLGRYVLLPGDRTRAAKIAERFRDVTVVDNPRGHTAHLGVLEHGGARIDVLSISSGMGCPSVEIVLHELLQCGAKRLVRVGSCGALVPGIAAGQVVIATGAVRDEGTTDHYAPKEFPAIAHHAAVEALAEGARRLDLASDAFLGIVHSKDSLYAREFGHGPAGERNREYKKWIGRAGTIASEMEAAALFVVASAATASRPARALGGPKPADDIEAGCVLAVFGDDTSDMDLDPKLTGLAEERAIGVAVAGIGVWAELDGVVAAKS